MKKVLITLMLIIMCVFMCSCGEDLEGTTLTYMEGCTARFSNGTLYMDVFDVHNTFSYELGDDNTIIIEDSITYTYEIDGNTVKFDKEFMGVSDIWWK